MIRPDLIPSFYEFGYRYCDPRQAFEGIDFDHSSNLTELKKIIDKRIMAR
jgi:SWI/SNF-related matrix-associated actin-dependent regulator 1 of chromatin subfamily A